MPVKEEEEEERPRRSQLSTTSRRKPEVTNFVFHNAETATSQLKFGKYHVFSDVVFGVTRCKCLTFVSVCMNTEKM